MMSIAKGKISLWFCSSLDIKYFRCSLFSEFESNFFINTICDLGYKNVFLNFLLWSQKSVCLALFVTKFSPNKGGGGENREGGMGHCPKFFYS